MSETDFIPLLERLTDDAHGAMTLAREEARGLHHNWVGPEHLLLGLLQHQNAFAARALDSLGVTIEDAREQVVEGLIEDRYKGEREDRKALAERQLRKDWRNKRSPQREKTLEHALAQALRQAEISGRYYIGTVHLLRGLLQEPDGVAVRALSNLGVETPDVHRRVMEMLRSGEYQEKKRGGLHNFDRKGRKGTGIRLELLNNDKLARELNELLILTGIVEIPDENSSPPGLPSGERNEPPGTPLGNSPSDAELAARIEQAVEELGSHIEMMRDDLLGLELAHRKLFELIDDGPQDWRSTDA